MTEPAVQFESMAGRDVQLGAHSHTIITRQPCSFSCTRFDVSVFCLNQIFPSKMKGEKLEY